MYEHKLSAFEQQVTIIHPGEYLASRDDIIISTVLGSCIAVALWDEAAGIGGLNHFMLPGKIHQAKVFQDDNAKYGMYAMELLINELLKQGCRRERLAAKVFGGAMLLGIGGDGRPTVSEGNILFAKEYLKTERIPIKSSDVGGTRARKILFFVKTGKVLLKHMAGTMKNLVDREEHTYLDRIRSRSASGDIILFDPPRKPPPVPGS